MTQEDRAPQPEIAGPQTEPAVTPVPTPAAAPPVLDDDQRALLRTVLNQIVPARVGLAGAGDLGVGATIERTLAASTRLRRLFLEGMRDIEIASGAAFRDLDSAAQTAVLHKVEQRSSAFFIALVEHAYRGYYLLTEVQRAVGWDARPPQPLGHSLPPFDPAILEKQRQRAPFWRRTN